MSSAKVMIASAIRRAIIRAGMHRPIFIEL
jgi:hypothetical protein